MFLKVTTLAGFLFAHAALAQQFDPCVAPEALETMVLSNSELNSESNELGGIAWSLTVPKQVQGVSLSDILFKRVVEGREMVRVVSQTIEETDDSVSAYALISEKALSGYVFVARYMISPPQVDGCFYEFSFQIGT